MNNSTRLALGFCLLLYSTAQAGVTFVGDVTPNPENWTPSTSGAVGKTSSGTILIDNSDDLSLQQCILGESETGTGTITISGYDSRWNSNSLYVGKSGVGEFYVLNGGKVNDGGSCYLGYSAGSIGRVTVSGDDSRWNTTSMTVGRLGYGTLTIMDGAVVTILSSGGLTIDLYSRGGSFINMSGGGRLALSGDVDGSLTEFFGQIQGTDAIRWWDFAQGSWAPLTTSTPDSVYTLAYQTTGELVGYTVLTVLEQEATPLLPGDANLDGVVDGSDATILAGYWQQTTGVTWEMGDFNHDGVVDGSDATILAGYWQSSQGDNATAVPEPGTMGLLGTFLFGLLALGFVRRIL